MTSMARTGERVDQIVEYLKKNVSKGYRTQDLKWALISQGYSKIEVDKGMKEYEEFRALQRPKLIEPPKPEVIVEMPKVEPEKKGFFKRLFGS
jgi:hypothetical protein